MPISRSSWINLRDGSGAYLFEATLSISRNASMLALFILKSSCCTKDQLVIVMLHYNKKNIRFHYTLKYNHKGVDIIIIEVQ